MVMPRWQRMQRRDWKNPFSWFDWYFYTKPKTLFKYQPQGATYTGERTFARADASTCATYVDSTGLVKTVAANVLRDQHYINGLGPYILLEGSRQNLCLQSGFAATWAGLQATLDANAYTAPDGTGTTYSITETAVNNSHFAQQSVTLTAATYCFSVFAKVKSGTRGLGLYNDVAGVGRAWDVNGASYGGWAGAPTAYGSQSLGNGYYRFWITSTGTAVATAHKIFLLDGLNVTYAGDGTSGWYVWGAQVELGAFPSSIIPTTTGAVTRAADALSFPIAFGPQSLTTYLDVTNSGSAGGTLVEYRFVVGNTAYAGLQKFFQMSINASFQARMLASNTGGAADISGATTYTTADRMETCGSWSSAGAVSLTSAKNGGAAETAVTGSLSQPAEWQNNVVQFQSNFQWTCVRSIKIAAGVQTLATMRAL